MTFQDSAKLRAPLAHMAYEPQALCALLPHMLCTIRASIPHVPRALRSPVLHVLCALRTPVSCMPYASRVLNSAYSCTLRALLPHVPHALRLPCLVFYIFNIPISMFPYVTMLHVPFFYLFPTLFFTSIQVTSIICK